MRDIFHISSLLALGSSQRSQSNVVIPLEDLAFDPHATRTVFVGNLDKGMTHGELRNIFERFGEVVVCNCLLLGFNLLSSSMSRLYEIYKSFSVYDLIC